MALQARLSDGAPHGIACGMVASSPGEGVSTWVELLARAASRREATVVAVTNRAVSNGATVPLEAALRDPAGLLRNPGSVTWLLTGADWRWDASRRRLWQIASDHWRARGVVVLVELNGADEPETLLVAEAFPHLIWLIGGGQARAELTSQRLETLRDARCRFVGAVLNREKKLFPRFQRDR
jgi:hypothetical protein